MEPIRIALCDLVPDTAHHLLEIASGTGQHAAHIAPSLPQLQWWPCEYDTARFPSIAAYGDDTPNMMAPQQVDVLQVNWAETINPERADVILNINMIHITPWSACVGLLSGAGAKLVSGGMLVLYGPFFQRAVAPVSSNLDFDQWLRQRDCAFGLRYLEDVETEAMRHGLYLSRILEMPANNLLVVLVRRDA